MDTDTSTFERFQLLGTQVAAATLAETLGAVTRLVGQQRSALIGHYNLHGLHLWRRDGSMRRFYRTATLSHIDGMSLVLLGRLLGHPIRRAHRVSYYELLPALIGRACDERWRVYFLGGAPGTAEKGLHRLLGREHEVALRVHHGFFDASPDSRENAHVLEDIRGFRPDLVLVGMGMPRQEEWALRNSAALGDCVVITCGAAIDYFSGEQPVAPSWMARVGLEWLYRLARDPRRLWRRYLFEPLTLAPSLFVDITRQRWIRLRFARDPRRADPSVPSDHC